MHYLWINNKIAYLQNYTVINCWLLIANKIKLISDEITKIEIDLYWIEDNEKV